MSKLSRLDKANYAIGVLGKLGVSKEQAFGALGSLAGESGLSLNTGAYNPKDPGGSIGIGQWNGRRARALKEFAAARGTSWKDFHTQVDFMAKELQTTHKSALNALKAAPNRTAASRAWTTKYEMPSEPHHKTRAQNADYFASLSAGTAKNVVTKDESVSGAQLPPDDTTTTALAEDASATRQERNKGIFGKLTDTLNEVADGISGAGDAITGKVTDAQNSVRDSSFFGDTSALGMVGAIAGGLVGGAPGSVIGGLLGQGIDRVVNRTEDETSSVDSSTDDGGIGGSIGRALGNLFGGGGGDSWGSTSSGRANAGFGWADQDRDGVVDAERQASGGMSGGFLGNNMGASSSGSHGEGPGHDSKGKSKK